jgi:hypothetical protein
VLKRKIFNFTVLTMLYAVIIYLSFLCGERMGTNWGVAFCLCGIALITFEAFSLSEWLC